MRTSRKILACAAGALMLGACGSDDNSSADPTTADPTTAETEADAVATTTEGTAASETTESSTAPEDTALETSTTGSDNTDKTTVDVPVSVPAIDDVPVCQAFARVVTTNFLVSASGLAPEGEATVTVERIEVVAYSGLNDDLATLRSDMPAVLVGSLEPFLARIDAADDALAAGGFSADDIAAIGAAWNDGLDAIAAGESPDTTADPTGLLDQTKLDAAEAAFLAAVGSSKDFEATFDTSDVDTLGTAWLNETCPLLASSTSG